MNRPASVRATIIQHNTHRRRLFDTYRNNIISEGMRHNIIIIKCDEDVRRRKRSAVVRVRADCALESSDFYGAKINTIKKPTHFL